MRSSCNRCGLVVLAISLLVGCQSTPSWHMPKWSLSRMNPFPSSHDKSGYPAKPSSLAAAASADASADYTAANSGGTAQAGYKSTAPAYGSSLGAYSGSGTQYPYPSTSANAPAGSTAAANSAVAPQNGYYGSSAEYARSGQPSSSSYSYGGASADSYRSYGSQSSAPAGSGYTTAPTNGSYASDAGTASRYGTASDRYGLDPSAGSASQAAAPDPYRNTSGYSNLSTADTRSSASAGSTSGYAPGSSTGYASGGYGQGGSTQASNQQTNSGYANGWPSAANSSSVVGDRYAQGQSADTGSTGYNSYRSGEYGNSAGNTNWDPGNTGYDPGNTGYNPGNTGYNPPGVGSYGSSTGYSSGTPYLPGSTKPLSTPPTNNADSLGASAQGFSNQYDSSVVPASHVRY
jgi:hypothetical protein